MSDLRGDYHRNPSPRSSDDELRATIKRLTKENEASDAEWRESLQKEYERAETHKTRAETLSAELAKARDALTEIILRDEQRCEREGLALTNAIYAGIARAALPTKKEE